MGLLSVLLLLSGDLCHAGVPGPPALDLTRTVGSAFDVDDVRLPGVPVDFGWQVPPAEPVVVSEAGLTVAAGPRTDLFADPAGSQPILSAPRALGEMSGDFQLLTLVSVELTTTFDAGALLLWSDPERWAKLALERSPDGEGTVVSVVTRGRSDDCNSLAVDDSSIWLRISRIADACALHVSHDGTVWRLIRHFPIAGWEPLEAGFLVQSPLGPGARATFSHVSLRPTTLADIRSGG